MELVESADRYKGTNIKSAVDKMRAKAIIRAGHDKTGLSLVHFNLSHFMIKSKHEDAFFILSQWAVEPIRTKPQVFIAQPREGYKSLHNRLNILLDSIKKREDATQEFVELSRMHMVGTVERIMSPLLNNTENTDQQMNASRAS